MLNAAIKNEKSLGVFTVGVVGVDKSVFSSMKRILDVTSYRSRQYKIVNLGDGESSGNSDGVDIVVVDTSKPRVFMSWLKRLGENKNGCPKEVVRLDGRKVSSESNKFYSISLPINPRNVLKVLDDYTIKELQFLPEFEIGNEKGLDKAGVAGMQLLQRDSKTRTRPSDLKALIVDDSLAVRRQLQLEFNLMNIATVAVDCGEAAIEEIQKNAFDIVFLDVVMPGMDGYAVCKQIKQSRKNAKTPVVLLTSKSSSFDKLKGTLAGCDTYLTKPINHNDFQKVSGKYFELVE